MEPHSLAGQQLIVTIWNVAFGTVLVVWAFGWTGGKMLVTDSYTGAKEKVAEQKAARAAKKEAEREAAGDDDEGAGLLGRVRPRRHDEADEP